MHLLDTPCIFSPIFYKPAWKWTDVNYNVPRTHNPPLRPTNFASVNVVLHVPDTVHDFLLSSSFVLSYVSARYSIIFVPNFWVWAVFCEFKVRAKIYLYNHCTV